MGYYAVPRFTKDLDILVSVDTANASAVFDALSEFGAPLAELTASDFETEGYFYQMGKPPFRVDILMSIPGVSFDDAWDRREVTTLFEGVEVNFISKEDLIVAKRASGRPQDLLDVDALEQR